MSNRLVIVGAGRVGADLMSRLSGEYEITCIEQRTESIEALKPILESHNLSIIQGDATSRLILQEAQVEDADIVLLTVSTENINLEVARVLREKFSVPRIISIGITPEGIAELEKLGVEVANIFRASAHNIMNIIQSRIRTPQGIGAGQGEILEVTVHPQSRLVNKPLARLAPKNWQVGIIYRNEAIIVPGGKVRLMPDDRVVIMGVPSVLKSVSELLTFSTHDFPLEYGSLALVYLKGSEQESYFSEVEYLLKTLPFSETVFMLSPAIKKPDRFKPFFERCPHIYTVHTAAEKHPLKSILNAAGMLRRNCGLIIGDRNVLLGTPKLLPYRKNLVRQIARSMESFYSPILFCAGTFPYQRAVVPAIPPSDIKPLLETALEISGQMASELSVFLCPPSVYTGGEPEKTSYEKMKKTVSDLALLYKRKISTTTLNGNPVLEVSSAAQEQNLLLLEPPEWVKSGLLTTLLNPDPVLHLLARSSISILLQPSETVKKNPLLSNGGPL